MSVKGFITEKSYTQITNININKSYENVSFMYTVYRDEIKASIILSSNVTVNNANAIYSNETDDNGNITPILTSKGDYDKYFKDGLASDSSNIIALCYIYLKTLNEFKDLEDC